MRQKVINDDPLIIVGIPSTQRFKGSAAADATDRAAPARAYQVGAGDRCSMICEIVYG